jgi:drug/metabolite transporter (DMT)-like permease
VRTPKPETVTTSGSPPGHYDVRAGILWVLVSAVTFAMVNVGAKYLALTYDPGQVVWARFFFQFVIVAAMLGPRLLSAMATSIPRLQAARSVAMATCTGLYFYGLEILPIATVTAVMFSAPLIVTALSVPLLREAVGPRRWAAVLVGFGGVLMIVRPEGDLLRAEVLIPFGAALGLAFYHLSTRMASRADRPETTLVYTTLAGAVIFSLHAPAVWIAPDLEGWVLLIAIGAVGTVGHFALIKSLALAPIAVVSAFAYSTLVFTAIGGVFVFGEVPDTLTVAGSAVMIASGVYIFRRERQTQARTGTKER